MEDYDLLKNSIYKNIQEFTEFVVNEFNITNYYDLVEYIIDLHNFKAKVWKLDQELFIRTEKELKRDYEKEME